MRPSILKSVREGTRRRLRIFGWVVAAGTLVGIFYGGLIGFTGWGYILRGGYIGAVHGFIISFMIGLLEIFALRTRVGRWVDQKPLILTILIKGLVYGTVITIVELGNIGEMVVVGKVNDPVTARSFAPVSIAFSFLVTFIIMFLLQISRLVGGQTLLNLVLGRYHRPRLEERFFLFVDIIGSTPLAEKIGPLSMHRFLNQVFALVADPITDHHGEIYQYVGDEIVITWRSADGRHAARPLACFFAIQSALDDAASWFEDNIDVIPAVRGALHVGPVVSGEVGVNRRSIVFHGDVMNAGARLEQATRDMGCPFLVSGDAIALIEGKDGFYIHDHGRHTLRGRQTPMQIYEVKTSTTQRSGEG
jgi:adenylate cyclase